MIGRLYISNPNHKWDTAELRPCNNNNIHKIIADKKTTNCCASSVDLTWDNIHLACTTAVEIDITNLNLRKVDWQNFEDHGRLFNELSRHKHKVKGNLSYDFVYWPKYRRPNHKILWTAGCSNTIALEVAPNERWAKLLADNLQLEEVCIATGGSSLSWAADKILRADLQTGDTVVWGLTNTPRVEYGSDWKLHPITAAEYAKLPAYVQHWDINYFSSQTQTLKAMQVIEQVQNVCKKLEVELYLFNLTEISWVAVLCDMYPNYLDLIRDLPISQYRPVYVDFGVDNSHPGPLQNKKWAETMFDFIKKRKISL